MAHPLHLVIAVTGFLLLTVIGLRLIMTRPVAAKRRLPYSSPEEYRALARVALEAELREPRYLEDGPDGLPEGRFDGHGGSVFCRSCLRDFPAGTPIAVTAVMKPPIRKKLLRHGWKLTRPHHAPMS
jgi:hypothetical protein